MAVTSSATYKAWKPSDAALLKLVGLTNADTEIPHGLADTPAAVIAQVTGSTAGTIVISSVDSSNVTLKSNQAGGVDADVWILAGPLGIHPKVS